MTDIEEIRKIILAGGNMRDIISKYNSYNNIRMAEYIFKYHERKRDWKPRVLWFWGESNEKMNDTAKQLLGADYYMAPQNFNLWEGYDAHECVMFDNLKKGYFTLSSFLGLADKYSYSVNTKDGSRQFLAKTIIFTSMYHPDKFFEEEMSGEDTYCIKRRIDKIVHFSEPNVTL